MRSSAMIVQKTKGKERGLREMMVRHLESVDTLRFARNDAIALAAVQYGRPTGPSDVTCQNHIAEKLATLAGVKMLNFQSGRRISRLGLDVV